MVTRTKDNIPFEAGLANIAIAGLRILVQDTLSVPNGGTATYTVVDPSTRRVLVIHNSTAAFDIRYNDGAVAASDDLPILPQFYFVVDREKDQILGFRNADTIAQTMNIVELE